ncbi:MAG TPA: hypothetical protein VMW17_16065 [Candidatus Binatia bacterium]|nr:hypothetical protein [Candidatus Binatia bacterium]
MLFASLPKEGTSVGNTTLLQKLREAAKQKLDIDLSDDMYWEIRNALVAAGKIAKGRGLGGSAYRVQSANQGRKKPGGKWTRPDFALAAVKSFPYIPGKVLELITFEVKPADDYRIEGVFETAAHSRFSHKSCLLIYAPSGKPDTQDSERVEREYERFGLGL